MLDREHYILYSEYPLNQTILSSDPFVCNYWHFDQMGKICNIFMFTLDKLGFTIYSETCVNRTLNNSDSSINLNLDKVKMHKFFVNLTCINRTPVYSKNKSWFQGDYIWTGLTVQVMIITSDRVRNVTFGTQSSTVKCNKLIQEKSSQTCGEYFILGVYSVS